MTIECLQCQSFKGLTRFNGFELLAWDFNPRWVMRLSGSTQIEFQQNRRFQFTRGLCVP
jgi:hypothetical protein